MESKIIKVSSTTVAKQLAGAIASAIDTANSSIELHVIGASALNQAIKSVAIAQGMFSPRGMEILIKPSFKEFEINGKKKTGIRLMLLKQKEDK